jgi:hypothetical protein
MATVGSGPSEPSGSSSSPAGPSYFDKVNWEGGKLYASILPLRFLTHLTLPTLVSTSISWTTVRSVVITRLRLSLLPRPTSLQEQDLPSPPHKACFSSLPILNPPSFPYSNFALHRWWAVFWILFTTRNNGVGPDEAHIYNKVRLSRLFLIPSHLISVYPPSRNSIKTREHLTHNEQTKFLPQLVLNPHRVTPPQMVCLALPPRCQPVPTPHCRISLPPQSRLPNPNMDLNNLQQAR